jgi:hypothetical protein
MAWPTPRARSARTALACKTIPAPHRGPGRAPLDQLGTGPGAAQRDGQGQPGDSAAHDQDASGVSHVRLPLLLAPRFRAGRQDLARWGWRR